MTEKKRGMIKKEIDAMKDLVKEGIPRLSEVIFNPASWQSTEQLQSALGNAAAGFAASRVKKLLEEILGDRKNVDEKVLDSEKSARTMIDLVKFAAQENPDLETWEAAKKIFRRTLQKNVTDSERDSLYDLIAICKELSGTEIRILAGSYQIVHTLEAENSGNRTITWWAERVAKNIGLATREQVFRYEDNLIKQQLIMPREGGHPASTWLGAAYGHRLTPLGLKLAELLSEESK